MKVLRAEFILSAMSRKDFLRDGRKETAFVGRSNVGKSTLLNRLLGRRKLARTSSTPGRTRAVNYFLVNNDRYFVDLPGYGWAKVGRRDRQSWAQLVEAYFDQALPEARVILLVDGKVGATPLDVQAFDFLSSRGASLTLVATKIDRVRRPQRQRALNAIRATLQQPLEVPVLAVSGETGEGMQSLWAQISGSTSRTG